MTLVMNADDGQSNETITNEFFAHCMDPEGITEKWLLTGSWWPILTSIFLYLLVVLKLGPLFMEGRSPYKLKIMMRLYNIGQVFYNLVIVFHYFLSIEGDLPIALIWKASCASPVYLEGKNIFKYKYLLGSWCFILLKVFDLFDTIFMILRKKNSHISFLHVYHHVSMVFFPWFCLKYIKPLQATIPVFINLVVHSMMYFYYFLATYNSFKKYLWWKRHLTKLQLAQFGLILSYLGMLYYRNCCVSQLFTIIWASNVFFILCLFVNFYVKAYILKDSSKPKITKVKKSS